jgi:hypothetical protein
VWIWFVGVPLHHARQRLGQAHDEAVAWSSTPVRKRAPRDRDFPGDNSPTIRIQFRNRRVLELSRSEDQGRHQARHGADQLRVTDALRLETWARWMHDSTNHRNFLERFSRWIPQPEKSEESGYYPALVALAPADSPAHFSLAAFR